MLISDELEVNLLGQSEITALKVLAFVDDNLEPVACCHKHVVDPDKMTEDFQTNSELYVNRVILADDTSEEQVGKDTNPDSCLVRKGMSLGKCSRAYLLHSDSMHSAVSHEKSV